MKLKSQLIISIGILGAIFLIIFSSYIFTNQQVNQLNSQEQIARKIQTGANDLSYLSNDFFLYQESSQATLFHTKISSLTNDLSKLNPANPTQAILINNTKSDLQRLDSVFSEATSFLENSPRNVSVRVLTAFQTAWSRLAVQSETLTHDSAQLSQILRDQSDQLKQTNSMLVFAMVGAFAVYFVMIYFLVFRRTFRSITKLEGGTKIVGSGNLDYSIAAKGNDEIGELSRAFDQMTTNLKTVTASKTDLEQAQASLRASEQRWATTLASIGDAVISTDSSGKIIFMNSEAEKLTGWTLSEASQTPVKTVFHIINEQSRLEVENPIDRVLREGLVVGLANHTVLIRKDGAEVPINDSGAPIRDKDGRTTGVVLVFRDFTERKNAEEELLNSEERLNRSQEIAHLGSWELDLVKNKLTWSNEAYRIFGLKPQEFGATYEAFLQAVHPDDRQAVDAAYSGSLREGRDTYEIDHRVVRKSTGEIRIVHEKAEHIRDKQGKIIRSIGMVHDITERKKAEEELRESEERFSKAFHNSPVPQIITRVGDFRYVDANECVLSLLEYSRVELIGHTSAELDLLVESNKRDQGILVVDEEGELRDLETKVRTKSGKIITVLTSSETMTLNGQKHLINTFIDITQRKKGEESLQKQAALIDLSPDAIIVKDLGDIIQFWSDGAEKLYGYTRAEAIGRNARLLLLTKFPEKLDKIVSQLEHDGRWFGELMHQTKAGQVVIVQSWWLMKINEDGEGEIFESNVDITERRMLQEKLEESAVRVEEYATQMEELANQRAAQLKDAERLATIGTTAGMVGHDIRNPLQAITSDLFLAKTDLIAIPESEEKKNIQESLTEIEKNIDYINKIVADLQDFARPLKPNAEETDLKQIIDDLLSKNGLPENVKVNVKVETGKIVTDSTFINRIMYNLVNNAVQAMPKGGKLTIRTYKEGNDTIISVKDTGVGIPEVVKGKLFTPMFTTKSKGQGFGLAVIKRMTEALGGTVSFESQEGKGTTFKIRLPQNK